MKSVLVVTDNRELCERVRKLVEGISDATFDFACSRVKGIPSIPGMQSIRLRNSWSEVSQNYELIISLHCKQLFPAPLVNAVRCVNVHPGLNPYNRGWFPQVFSIINGLPLGATIHEMDEDLDHGSIIAQGKVEVFSWDTSFSAYCRVLDKEMELLDAFLPRIVQGDYEAKPMSGEGNINHKRDFSVLCEIDLNRTLTWEAAINTLRALTHPPYKNAYFYDREGKKVNVGIDLDVAEELPGEAY